MTNYRRAFHKGGTYFFTLNLADRHSTLLTDNIKQLRHAFTKVKVKYPFNIDAIVVLPDHIHCVMTLPDDDFDYSKRWRLIKTHFSKSVGLDCRRNSSQISKKEKGIWQRRFWEHLISDQEDYNRHIDYCYINPVKHGYVKRVSDWFYSSFDRDVRAGIYPTNWGPEVIEAPDIDFGES